MNITEICLVVIVSIMFLKGLVVIVILIAGSRKIKREMAPLIRKTHGILDSLSSVSDMAREQVEELQTVINDISYKTREVTQEVQQKIMPVISDIAQAISGIARILTFFTSRKKQ